MLRDDGELDWFIPVSKLLKHYDQLPVTFPHLPPDTEGSISKTAGISIFRRPYRKDQLFSPSSSRTVTAKVKLEQKLLS